MSVIRLDKYLSVAKNISRTDAKKLIKSGAVTVDNKRETKTDTKVDTEKSRVLINGEPAVYKEYIYILMNKPSGILSASTDKRAKTVIDIVPKHLKREGLFPVGRLDKTTTGLLIITNDGDFAHRVISPKSGIDKCYYTELDGELTPMAKEELERGAVLADGTRCLPSSIKMIEADKVYITIREGKYHQVKRMFGTVGLGVNRLHRISVGGLRLPDTLKAGECSELSEKDLDLIYY